MYAFNKMQALESVAHLFKPHDLIGSNNPVGGLEMIENKTSEGSFLYNKRDPTKPAIPKLATPMEVELRSVVVKIPKITDVAISKALNKVRSGGSSIERTLRVALHNGHCTIPLQTGRRAGGRKKISGMADGLC